MNTEQTLYESLMDPINLIEDNLFLGNRAGAEQAAILRMCEITAVVQIQSKPTEPFHPGQFKYHTVTFGDVEEDSLMKILPDTLKFIHAERLAGGKVFVHCDAGVSRSGSVVIAYTMATKQLMFPEALQYVRSRRPCVGPNDGFLSQLQQFTPESLAQLLV